MGKGKTGYGTGGGMMARYSKKLKSDPQLRGLDKAVELVTQGSYIEGGPAEGRAGRPGRKNADYSGWRSIFNPVFCYNGMILVAGALTVLGIIMVFSSSSVNLVSAGFSSWRDASRQLLFAVIGLLAGVGLVHFSDAVSNLIRYTSLFILLGSWVLQALTLTSLGKTVNGNTGWLVIAGTQFQPAEIMKLALCLWMPLTVASASRRAEGKTTLVQRALAYWPALVTFLISFILVFAGKDLGTGLIIAVIALIALYVGGFPLGLFFGGLIIAGGAVSYFFVLGNENRRKRLLAVYSGCPGGPSQDGCYQIVHGKYALSSGGLTGLGLGASREKWNYLPEAKNDFIFAIIGEELGYIGAVFVILLFLILAWCMVNIALRSNDTYSQTVILCVTGWIIFQAFVNIGVVTSVLPVIGLPLPFISAGGSALIITLMAMGIVIGLSRRQEEIRASLGRDKKRRKKTKRV